ncbi:hypothetical protein BDQ12DRAFT_711574 [Crucibulum laeve]|uniref:Steroid 5-alpha reductase C-terminal domain-containing protein n=1 Tax=Crucibulum laeve TaxID=68775 RepID=A0A5C3M5I2_9AGAR|nr:hypothetical protein BDQ12DRAFT_711574 [Crucibulum laeve]
MSIFGRLLPIVTCSYTVQALLALIFVPLQDETYFDLCGAIGWLSTTFISLYYPTLNFAKYWDGTAPLQWNVSMSSRQLLLTAALGIWSLRMGTFLTWRAVKAGGDIRFSLIKRRPLTFSIYWFAQATWIVLVGLPVYLCNIVPSHLHPALVPLDFCAVALYAASLLFEVIADLQKTAWKRAKDLKQHDESFISSGLWSISRHPKLELIAFTRKEVSNADFSSYVGEVGLWTGIWALSITSLRSSHYPMGTWLLAAISPLFSWFLVRKVSGIPGLERIGDKRFGANPKWQQYKKAVPIFWPWGGLD